MARRRDTTITEDVEDLQRLEKQYRGKPEFARITTIRLIKANENLSIGEVAAQIGYSVPTVKRWLKAYRTGGMDLLLQMNAGGKQDVSDEGLNQLKQKLLAGEFHSFAEAHRWIDRYHHSLALRKLARQAIAGNGRKQSKARKEENRSGMESVAMDLQSNPPLIPENILRFLNSIPTTYDSLEWNAGFRAALVEFLGDVDRIALTLNVQCEIIHPERETVTVGISEMTNGEDREIVAYTEEELTDETEHLARLFARMQRLNFPFENYQAPKGFVYYYGGVVHLAVMALWREKGKPPISERTLQTIEQLRPFLIFLFSDSAARNQVHKPGEGAFMRTIEQLTASSSLTLQEERVFMMQLMGCSYDEIAETLKISLNTVRSHVKAIHGKTGAQGASQVIAKYFIPSATRSAIVDKPGGDA